MSYLIPADYKRFIQADNLNQVIGQDSAVLTGAELTAQAEVISYLVQKYQIAAEFADLLQWSPLVAYKAGQRIYLNAPAYAPASTYALNDLSLYGGTVYKCTASTTGTFDIAKWAAIGAQYTMFYVSYPYPRFDPNYEYPTGTLVWYNDNTYVSQRSSVSVYQGSSASWDQVQYSNPYPGTGCNGRLFWGTGTPYSVTAGTLPTDTTKFTAGDSRNQQLVTYAIDIALYHIHSRIAPNNIPDLRVKRYDDAIKWLKMAGTGAITPGLPLILPRQGNRIRYASELKTPNTY